jgi:hypothetical protein
MNKKIVIIFLALTISCKNSSDNNDISVDPKDSEIKKPNDIKPVITLNAPDDTNSVYLNYSSMSFKLMYSRNTPQYVVIDDKRFGQREEMSHYQRLNKGFYISFNTDSSTQTSFGEKYINDSGGIDVVLKKNGYGLRVLNIWKDYTNEGVQYDFSKIDQAKITVYNYKNGNIIDSFILHK